MHGTINVRLFLEFIIVVVGAAATIISIIVAVMTRDREDAFEIRATLKGIVAIAFLVCWVSWLLLLQNLSA